MKRLSLVVLLASVGCIELTLPEPPPPPGPGSIQGTAVYSVAGRTGYRPAGGTRITLINTGTQTFADRETGRFDLRNVRVSDGLLYFVFDLDGDGTADRQRALDLSAIGAGPGRDIALGEVVLSRNATVVGRVLRGDNPLPTGHAGTAVFVPGAPFATATADTGDFVLENLPEGPLQLAFYRQGYKAESRDLSVRGGEEARVAAASLTFDPQAMAATVTVTGTIRFDDGTPVANARVRFASSANTFTTTTDASGAFSAQTMSAQLYQVGVEADGAVSLRLYNVLLLPGANELPPVQLTRGTSTPLDLDAGQLLPPDAGSTGNSPIAVIDPALLELAPGASGTLSSGRSPGRRPLTSHWRSAADGGLQLTFDTPDTTSTTVRVFAPDAAGLYPFTLRLTDVLGEDSPEARGAVRVGSAPTVAVTSLQGTTVPPGALVTLQATATSTDGRPIDAYRWRQLTGPLAADSGTLLGPLISFPAPIVSGLTPMTFEVKATTDLGFESAPASITLALQPVTQATLTSTATPAVVFQDGGQHLVQLNATVIGGPPDASYSYTWAPLSDGCPLADGGRDLTCPEAWTLSNAAGPRTELFAPRASGHRTLNFTVTAMPGGLTSQVSVDVRDARRPSCRSFVSTISYEVQCDEPVLVTGAFDAGPMGPVASVVVDGGSVIGYFQSVAARVPMDVDLPLVDLGGNPPQPYVTGAVPRLSYPATWVTPPSVSSATATRPAWLRLGPGGGFPSRRAIVGRASDGMFRRVLVLDPTPCTGVCAVTPNVFENINGTGNQPSSSTSAVSVDGRAYVIVSPQNPPGLVEYRNGSWREVPVFASPMLGALATDGKQLWVLSEDGGTVERRAWSPGDDGGSYGPPEAMSAGLFAITSAELGFTPSGKAFSLVVNNAAAEQLEWFGPGSWGPAVAQLGLTTQLTAAKFVMLGESLHEAITFSRVSDGFLDVSAWDPQLGMTYSTAIPLMQGTLQDFDVARFGNGALLAWTQPSGEVQLTLVGRTPSGVMVNDVTLEDGGVVWNTLPGRWPRVAVEGAEVLLSWQEEVDAGAFGMAGTVIR